MKIIVRSFVVALAVTGFVATTATPTHAKVAAAKTSALPTPSCAPGTGNGCGIGQW